jgi:hypothetical protein
VAQALPATRSSWTYNAPAASPVSPQLITARPAPLTPASARSIPLTGCGLISDDQHGGRPRLGKHMTPDKGPLITLADDDQQLPQNYHNSSQTISITWRSIHLRLGTEDRKVLFA